MRYGRRAALLLVGAAGGIPAGLLVRRTAALRAELDGERAQVVRLVARDREHTELLAKASHDLRTPLTSILGHLEVIAEDPDLSGAGPGLRIIERNARRLLSMVEDLLPAAPSSEVRNEGAR